MIQGHYLPLTETEEELMEELFIVTREANNEGVPKDRIAQMLMWYAATAIDPQSGVSENVDEPSAQSHTSPEGMQETASQTASCPSCGGDVSGVTPQLGGQLIVAPCNCVVDWEDRKSLGRYAEEIED